ncbi:MAG: hypothetical protein ACREOZ_01380 [Gloeomargaritales cyanobacterium]
MTLEGHPDSGLISMRGKGRPKKFVYGNSSPADEAKRIREALKISLSQKLLLGVAFVTDHNRRLAQMFPHFWCMDVTAQTNSEKRELFIVAGKGGSGCSFPAVHVFCPLKSGGFSIGYTPTVYRSYLGKIVFGLIGLH